MCLFFTLLNQTLIYKRLTYSSYFYCSLALLLVESSLSVSLFFIDKLSDYNFKCSKQHNIDEFSFLYC